MELGRQIILYPVFGTFTPASGTERPTLASPIQARHLYAGRGLEDHANDKGLKYLEVKAGSPLSTIHQRKRKLKRHQLLLSLCGKESQQQKAPCSSRQKYNKTQ